MPGYRYHSFTETPIHDVRLAPRARGLNRLWERFVLKIFWKLENMQAQWTVNSFLENAYLGEGCRITPQAWCLNAGRRENIRIGNNVILRGIVSSERLHPGQIIIGDNVYIGDDTILSAAEHIEIGAWTMIAHGVQVMDNNAHPTDPFQRKRDHMIAAGRAQGERPGIDRAPIIIGPHAWIGFNAIIMKGVTLGEGCIVAAGSVVTHDVPPFSIAAGNPAQIVKRLPPISLDE